MKRTYPVSLVLTHRRVVMVPAESPEAAAEFMERHVAELKIEALQHGLENPDVTFTVGEPSPLA